MSMSLMTSRFTIREAAAELRKSERWLRDWLKAHPQDVNGQPFFAKAGRTKLFTPADIDRIHEAMRPATVGTPRDQPSSTVRPDSTDAWAAAARLLGRPFACRVPAAKRNGLMNE
jgi:hypothetical protein